MKELTLVERISSSIRDIPDFPKQGIVFKDITPLLSDGELFHDLIKEWANRYREKAIDKIVALDARGFLFGAALSQQLKTGLVPVRKAGKLPYKTHQVSYQLEYGSNSFEIHQDALRPQERIVIIDDLLATGGSAQATVELCHKFEAQIVETSFLIELEFLKGAEKLSSPTHSWIKF